MLLGDILLTPMITSGIIRDPNEDDKNCDITSEEEKSNSMEYLHASIIGIERHRLLIDGEGITTLVGFQGCPLRCKYCINKQCWDVNSTISYTPKQLYEVLKKDNLYFVYTHGGITFGGGEPGLYCDFILDFKKVCNPDWRIYLETSLNFPIKSLKKLLPVIDFLIVDVKDLNETIYKEYAGCSNEQVLANLRYISENGYSDKIQIRLPLIPAYNTDKDREVSEKILREIGFTNFDKFDYRKETKLSSLSETNPNKINYGKAVCEVLKQARIELAKEYSIKYEPNQCNHLQCSKGSCPVCENELLWLESQINKINKNV